MLAVLLVLAGVMPAAAQEPAEQGAAGPRARGEVAPPRNEPQVAQQRARPEVAQQRVRVARLADDLRRAEDGVKRARASVMEGVPLDTIRERALLLLVEPRDRELAMAAAARASGLLEQTYGSAAARLAATPLVLRRGAARGAATDTVGRLALSGLDGMLREFDGEDVKTVSGQLARQSIASMRALMDRDLQAWIGNYGTSARRPSSFTATFEELATTPSPLGRRCLVGDVAACTQALAMREPDDALWRWYEADYRRAFVRSKRWALRPGAPELYDACRNGSDHACDAVLRSASRVVVEPPVRSASRHSFVAVALELGGPDAFARLLDGAGRPLDERLSAAAGVPIDSVAAAWQARVAGAAPQRAGFPATTAASALMWILFFAFLSSRSTRWR